MKAKISELSPTGIVLRIIRKVNFFDAVSQRIMTRLITDESWRTRLNKFHNELDFDEKGVFHGIFHKIFAGDKLNSLEGVWTAQFLDSQIKMPLKEESSWLDWENAISIVGHDADVKQTYETLLKSKYRPAVFFDVGANYGTHSLLFLAQGIKTISFEPNPACQKKFGQFCRLNNFPGQMQNVAVGERDGTVNLWFPEKATWLGTIVESTKEGLQEFDLEKLEVPIVSLDSYTAKSGLFPDLIKIDTEGNELGVIKGATETIKKSEPIVIFECNQLSNKVDLWKAFDALGYVICPLPLLPQKNIRPLSLEEFTSEDKFNFAALTASHPILNEKL